MAEIITPDKITSILIANSIIMNLWIADIKLLTQSRINSALFTHFSEQIFRSISLIKLQSTKTAHSYEFQVDNENVAFTGDIPMT